MTERDPSAAVFASMLLSVTATAHSALIELRDMGGDTSSRECEQHLRTYEEAAAFTLRLVRSLEERQEEISADPEMPPILEAVRIVTDECVRLSRLIGRRARVDAQFEEIAERLKQGGVGS